MPEKTDANGMTAEDRKAARTFRTRQHLRGTSKGFSAREADEDERARLQAAADKMLADARRGPQKGAK